MPTVLRNDLRTGTLDEIADRLSKMSNNVVGNTWQENSDEMIILVNRSRNNYILELPAGRFRLDAGRRMRTLRSIMKVQQVKQLVDQGSLAVENSATN